jgi:co-chaperonin GroES (HSP10)
MDFDLTKPTQDELAQILGDKAPSRPHREAHEEDPRLPLMRDLGNLDHIKLFNNQILVAIYKRPERTKGGIIRIDSTRKEDEYQGKVGLVLKTGPLAFEDDDRNQFHGQRVEPGDWVGYRVQDGWTLIVNGPGGAIPCRVLEDVHIRIGLTSPDDIF